MVTPSAANAAFYRAFESQDLEAMGRVWKQSDEVRCAHPGEPPLTGWAAVETSWRRIFEATDLFRVRVSDVHVLDGDRLAVVTCLEHITAVANGEAMEGAVAATNVFERVEGEWRLIHHQGSGLSVRSTTVGVPTSNTIN